MDRAAFSREELLSEHAYAHGHEAAGYRLHGGFDEAGRYIPPRTLGRWPAVRAWQRRLAERGLPLLPADPSLLVHGSFPSFEQHRALLLHGFGQPLWNSLTITGVFEARGKLLAEFPFPDFRDAVTDDLSETATGHLNGGLLSAHGLDEGGDPASGLGAHDAMWFAIRDLLLGRDAWPIPAIPETISRPDGGRLAPGIPLAFEQMLLLLMNVLMIEVRAELAFDTTQRLATDAALFSDRRKEASLAAAMVERIREDERIHVAYLRTVLSEMRGFTWKADSGQTLPGHAVVDPAWRELVRWHAEENPRLHRATARPAIREEIRRRPDGERLLALFDALDVDAPARPAVAVAGTAAA